MKKLISTTVLLAALTLPVQVFALSSLTSTETTLGNDSFACSTGVTISAAATTTAWAAASKHLSGNKEYGMLHSSTNISENDSSAGSTVTAVSSETALGW